MSLTPANGNSLSGQYWSIIGDAIIGLSTGQGGFGTSFIGGVSVTVPGTFGVGMSGLAAGRFAFGTFAVAAAGVKTPIPVPPSTGGLPPFIGLPPQ
jgi:hypothetical protein